MIAQEEKNTSQRKGIYIPFETLFKNKGLNLISTRQKYNKAGKYYVTMKNTDRIKKQF